MNTLRKSEKIEIASSARRSLKIAICGIRGVPACYGGFETFAEEIGPRLAERGHSVRVYGRSHVIDYKEPSYRGMEIVLLDAPQHKYLETPVHTLRSFLHLLKDPVDVVLVCNAANSPFVWIPRLRGLPVAINLDGVERKRAKWNMLGRLWYRLGEFCSVLFASKMVADAEVIRSYYKNSYFRGSEVIRYGCHELDAAFADFKTANIDLSREEKVLNQNVFDKHGVLPGQYFLYVSRLEPENNAHIVIEAYNALPDEKKKFPLLIVGDAPYADDYIQQIKGIAGDGVKFLGYCFGSDYKQLQMGAYLYVQATEVGGTHPALVEAMGFANAILANKTPENVEVLSSAGFHYEKNDVQHLSRLMEQLIVEPDKVLELRTLALERARACFDWSKITLEYEQLFDSLAS